MDAGIFKDIIVKKPQSTGTQTLCGDGILQKAHEDGHVDVRCEKRNALKLQERQQLTQPIS